MDILALSKVKLSERAGMFLHQKLARVEEVMKEDRMDVEPCYPLLESAETLASSQKKFQTLYSNGPHHGDVRSLTEDWKVGPWSSDVSASLNFPAHPCII